MQIPVNVDDDPFEFVYKYFILDKIIQLGKLGNNFEAETNGEFCWGDLDSALAEKHDDDLNGDLEFQSVFARVELSSVSRGSSCIFRGQKLKSERINGLRKQYDAFLGEDKKRKERNEFILGRLDKMRNYSTALQLRYKPNSVVSGQIPYERAAHELEHPVRTQDQLTRMNRPNLPLVVPKDHALDEIILQELSRKYILIPKLPPTASNDFESDAKVQNIKFKKVTEDNNTDWKSKYDILDQLKRKDKDGVIEKSIHKDNYTFKLHNGQVEHENTQKYEIETNNDDNLKYKHEIPEKDIIDTNVSFDLADTEQHDIKHPYYKMHTANALGPSHETAPFDSKIESKISEHMQNLVLNDNIEIDTEIDVPKIEEEPYSGQQIQENYDYCKVECPSVTTNEYDANAALAEECDKNAHGDNTTCFNEDITSNMITPDDLVIEVRNETKPDTINEFPIEIINTQDFTPNEDVKLDNGVNINPEDDVLSQAPIDTINDPASDSENVVIKEHTENAFDVTDIEAFDAEQREMFYSEQVIDPNADNAYPAEYTQNENFQQDEQYAYYQDEQEQSYPGDINEHEETSQRYDPNYEQQYEYKQEEYAQQEEPQQQVVYDQQLYEKKSEQTEQEYTQLQYEQQNDEPETHIEQQLDNEEGYAEKQNEEQMMIEKPTQKQNEPVANITTS